MITRRKLVRSVLIGMSIALVGYLTWLATQVTAQNSQVNRVTGIAWSPDGSKLATGDSDGAVGIWSAETSRLALPFQGHTGSVYAIAWNPDGSKLASGGYDDMTVQIWDTASGQLLTTLYGHEDHVSRVIWTADGSRLLSTAPEGSQNLRVWDSATGKLIAAYHIGTAGQMAWSPDGSKIALAGLAGILILDGTTFKLLSRFDVTNMGSGAMLSSVAWSPNGSKIASGSANGTIRLWNVQTGQVLASFGVDDQATNWYMSSVNSMTFSPDGSKLLSSSGGGAIRSWNVATGQMLGSMQAKDPSPALLYSAAWSPYGGRLALGGRVVSTAAAASPQTQGSGGDAVQIIVPFPSLDELQAISKCCVAQSDVQQRLTSRIDPAKLADFVSEVKRLPKEQIPPACAADMIAVADALQQQP